MLYNNGNKLHCLVMNMAIKFVPLGVVLQRMDRISTRIPQKFDYEGLTAYSDTPLDDVDDIDDIEITDMQKAKDLQMEFYDWITSQKPNGSYTTNPEAFYTPVFLRRYLNMCNQLNIPVKCLFVDYDGEERMWKFERPNGILLGYEVCNTPRNTDVICCLDMDCYAKHRTRLNKLGLFNTPEDANSFKMSYEELYHEKEKYYRKDQMFDLDMHIFRIYQMEEYPDFLI